MDDTDTASAFCSAVSSRLWKNAPLFSSHANPAHGDAESLRARTLAPPRETVDPSAR
jgi:hypothetical protein